MKQINRFAYLFAYVVTLTNWAYSRFQPPKCSDNPDTFWMQQLQKIGQRSTGTIGESLAREWLVLEVSGWIQEATRAGKIMSVVEEKYNGSHSLVTRFTLIRAYTDIPVIRINLSTPSLQGGCVALTAHFDSHVSSLGIVDDASGINVVLNTLKQLLHEPLQHPLCIFLTGAEEPGLDSSHAVLTHHHDILALINVESAGNDGLAALYRANSPTLLSHFAQAVPLGHGSVLGTDLSDTGVWLSETAYSIFDSADIPSLDIALYANSYVYHTGLDKVETFNLASLKHLQDTVFSLTANVVKSNWTEITKGGDTVFYDLLGYKTLYYPLHRVKFLHYALGILGVSFAFYSYSLEKSLLPTPQPYIPILVWAAQFIGVVLTLAGTIMPTIAVVRIHRALTFKTMTWYRNIFYPILLFGPSSLFGMMALQALVSYLLNTWVDARVWTRPHMIERRNMIYGLVMSGALCWRLTSNALGTSFYFSWMFLAVALAITWILALGPRGFKNVAPGTTFFGYFILWTFPATLSTYYGVNLLASFVPLMGRVGPSVNVDVTIAVLVGGIIASTCFPVVGLVHRLGVQSWAWTTWTLLLLVMVVLPPVIFSQMEAFDELHPQRIYLGKRWEGGKVWLDVARHDSDWMSFHKALESIPPVSSFIPESSHREKWVLDHVKSEWKRDAETKCREWDILYPRSLYLFNLAIPLPYEAPPYKPSVTLKQLDGNCHQVSVEHTGMHAMYISVTAHRIKWILDKEYLQESSPTSPWNASTHPRHVLRTSNGYESTYFTIVFCVYPRDDFQEKDSLKDGLSNGRLDVGGMVEWRGTEWTLPSSFAPVYLSSVVETLYF
jgi:hypothetical protein